MGEHEHTYTKEQLEEIYEQVPATYWDDSYANNRVQKLYYDMRFKHVNRMLADVPEAGKVLDVGCSSGFSLGHYAKARPDIHYAGADVAEHHIAYAKRERPQFTFAHAPAEALPFEENSFDAVTMLDVIEHVVDLEKTLSEVKRVLKPGGSFIVFVVEEHHVVFQVIWWLWLKTKGKVWEEAHLRDYNKKTLIADLEKAGFAIDEFKRSHGTTCLIVKAKNG